MEDLHSKDHWVQYQDRKHASQQPGYLMNPFPPIRLSTPRLELRMLAEADIPVLFSFYSHPEVMRYWSAPPMTGLEQAQQKFREIQSGYQSGAALQLGIQRLSDQALIGACTLLHFHWPSRRAEIGYLLGRPYWRQGYIQEALHALITYAFQDLDLNRLEADIDPRNTASARTLERLGFQKEGRLRQRWIVNGEVQDTDFYGLLRSEWLSALDAHEV